MSTYPGESELPVATAIPSSDAHPDRFAVPPLIRKTSEWAWRLVVIAAGLWVLGQVYTRLETVIVPVALALLITALLSPVVRFMDKGLRLPRSLAVVLAIIIALGIVAGILAFVITQLMSGMSDLTVNLTKSVNEVQTWLINGPLHLSNAQISNAGSQVISAIQKNQDAVTSGALTTATVIGEGATGALLMLFCTIFFLYGGGNIWQFVTRLVPQSHRDRVRHAGSLGFVSLASYVRATVIVAAVDGIGIGVGLAVLQVPLAVPLGSIVFLGAFIPIVGAVMAGTLAVFVALITKGFVAALITLAIVIAVMQIESHVLQPLLLGRAVQLHPLAVVLAIAAGIVLSGIIGGLLAVPIVAVLNTAVRSLVADGSIEMEAGGIDNLRRTFAARRVRSGATSAVVDNELNDNVLTPEERADVDVATQTSRPEDEPQ